MKIRSIIVIGACLAAWAFAQAPAPVGPQGRGGRGPQGPVVVSPEVAPDRHVTFRILAPQAQKVELRASDIVGLARTPARFIRNAEGVWEATAGPIDPGAYRYTFAVDGVAVMDPRNPLGIRSRSAHLDQLAQLFERVRSAVVPLTPGRRPNPPDSLLR